MNLGNKLSQFGGLFEWLTLMITLVGGFCLLDSKIERQGDRIDRLTEQQSARMDQQNARSDKLYENFTDLLKSNCEKK